MNIGGGRRRRLAIVLLILAAYRAPSQVQIRVQAGGPFDTQRAEPPPTYPSDQTVVRSLDEAKRFRAERALGKSSAAIQRIFNHGEDVWIQTPEKKWLSARSSAERMLLDDAALLADYRSQFEPEAAAELKEADDDPNRVGSVLRRFFLTPTGAEAAERLATRLLDIGSPSLAAAYLERLLECAAHKAAHSPALKLKAAIARLLVGEPLRGDDPPLNASVMFGGKPVVFGDLVRRIESPAIPTATLADWPLPFGNPSRTAQTAGGLPLLGAEIVERSRPLTDEKKLASQFDRVIERNRRKSRTTYFGSQPIIVGDSVFARTCRGVEAIDLRTGKPVWSASAPIGDPIDRQELAIDEWEEAGRTFNASSVESFVLGNTLYGTLTSDGKRVFLVDELHVQPGSYNMFVMGRDNGDAIKRNCNRLTALDAVTGNPTWHLGGAAARKANDLDGHAFFFGPPTPWEGRLYALAELQSEVGLWEIDPVNGRPLWKQRLMLMHRRVDADPFRRSQACAVTISEGIAVCSTNTARVFGVDLVAKTVLWERDFDSDLIQRAYLNFNFIDVVPPPDNPHVADPPMIVGSRVVFQGANLQGIHCLDLRTGRSIWRKQRAADQHVAGVYQGKILLVGSGRVRAIKLEEGDDAWLTSTPAASGRGVFANGMYLLATERGDCIAIDAATGKLSGTSLSIDDLGRPLGNLAAQENTLISLGRSGLRFFPLVEPIRQEAERALAKDPNDGRGLFLSGLIALNKQEFGPAAEKLLASMERGGSPEQRAQATRTLLRLASEENLIGFTKLDAMLTSLRMAAKEPRDKAVVARLEAQSHLNGGRWSNAIQAAEDQARVPGGGMVHSLTDASARDPWLWARAFINKTFDRAPPSEHEAILAQIERRHAPDFESGEIERLQQVALAYDRWPIGRRAVMTIGRRHLASRRLDLASLAFHVALKIAATENEIAAARSGLSAVADAGRLPRDAYWHLERWKNEAAKGRDADGRTFEQAASEFMKANGSKAPGLSEPKQWPLAAIRAEVVPRSEQRNFRGRQWIIPVGSEAPYFQRRAFAFRRGESTFASVDLASARTDHETTLGEETIRAGATRVRSSAPVLGHVYFAAVDDKIAAISVLDRGSAVWCHSPGVSHSAGDEFEIALEWSRMEDATETESNRIECVGPHVIVVSTEKGLQGLEPASGRLIWRRPDSTFSNEIVFGDDQCLVVANRKGEFTTIRPIDGETIAKGRWPWFDGSGKPERGRLITSSTTDAESFKLRLWDPLKDKDVWKRRFDPKCRHWNLQHSSHVAVAAPDGVVELVDRATGETTAQFTVPTPMDKKLTVESFRLGASTFAIVNQRDRRIRFSDSIQGVESRWTNGRLVAFPNGATKPAWETTLNDARVLGWPLDELPVMIVFETRTAKREAETSSTRVRVFEKATGRVLVESALPRELESIKDVSFDGRRSRLEFSGWTQKLQLWFDDPKKAAKKADDGPTLNDVGNLMGGLLEKLNKNGQETPKKK